METAPRARARSDTCRGPSRGATACYVYMEEGCVPFGAWEGPSERPQVGSFLRLRALAGPLRWKGPCFFLMRVTMGRTMPPVRSGPAAACSGTPGVACACVCWQASPPDSVCIIPTMKVHPSKWQEEQHPVSPTHAHLSHALVMAPCVSFAARLSFAARRDGA